jgi:hypothetical protein
MDDNVQYNMFDNMILKLREVEFIKETIFNEPKFKGFPEEFEIKYADYLENSKGRRN